MEKEIKLPFAELTVGEKTYMLRLTALAAVRLEEKLGCSVYKALERIDEISVLTEILYALIESYRPEMTKSDLYAIFDDYITSGGTVSSLNEKIAEALRISGFFGTASKVQES